MTISNVSFDPACANESPAKDTLVNEQIVRSESNIVFRSPRIEKRLMQKSPMKWTTLFNIPCFEFNRCPRPALIATTFNCAKPIRFFYSHKKYWLKCSSIFLQFLANIIRFSLMCSEIKTLHNIGMLPI